MGCPPELSTKEEVVTEGNTEAVNFRVPTSMKSEMKLIMQFRKFAGYGELFRALYRKEAEEVLNSPGFKLWLKMKEDDRDFTLAKLRETARKLGYKLEYAGDQKVLSE